MTNLMSPSLWLIAGATLMVAELIIPGGIVVFLGLGCLVVAAAITLGLVSSWVSAFTLFFISSLALILMLRSVVMRFAGGDYSRGNTIEILDEIGEPVTVVETIGPGTRVGRIEFRGTEWDALGDGSEILAGEQAQIVSRENVQYLVEKVQASKDQAQEQ